MQTKKSKNCTEQVPCYGCDAAHIERNLFRSPSDFRFRLAAGIVLCLIAGCLRPAIIVPPTPPEAEVSQLARHAMSEYAASLAESFETAADQLAAGEITTAAEANARLQAANAAARKSAFVPLDEKLNDELGGDRWDAEKAERLFREIAGGLQAAANKRESSGALTPLPDPLPHGGEGTGKCPADAVGELCRSSTLNH